MRLRSPRATGRRTPRRAPAPHLSSRSSKLDAPAQLRAHLQSRAVQKISRRHGAFAFGLYFGDPQPRRAAACDDEAVFSRFANGAGLEFIRASARFESRFGGLKAMAVVKGIEPGEGREFKQPVENIRCG